MTVRGYGLLVFAVVFVSAFAFYSDSAYALLQCDQGNTCSNGYQLDCNCGSWNCVDVGECCDADAGDWGTFRDIYTCEEPPPIVCEPTVRTCNGDSVFQHYSNCAGQDIEYCPLGCSNNVCNQYIDPCVGQCYNPPSGYCSGDWAVSYVLPGGCTDGGGYPICSYNDVSGTYCGGSAYCSDGKTTAVPYCSGGGCATSYTYCGGDYTACSGGNVYSYSPYCSAGGCYTSSSLAQTCTYGCTNGACDSNPCAGVTCNTPPANYCSGNTAVTYGGGSCSAGSCSYSSSSTNCAASSGWYNTGSTYAACSSGSACTAQNQEYRSYVCSGAGSCTYSVTNTQTVYSGCSVCTAGCTAGACVSTGTINVNENIASSYTVSGPSTFSSSGSNTFTGAIPGSYSIAASDIACYTKALLPPSDTLAAGNTLTFDVIYSAIVCNSPPDNYCVDGGTIMTFGGGTCSANVCSYTNSTQTCTYGCLSLPGADTCGQNTVPGLTDLTLLGSFGLYSKQGQSVTVVSVGSDANGENVRVECGSSQGAADLCTSGYFASGASCTFASPFGDSTDHAIYCRLRDSAGAPSAEQTATLRADNSAPTLSISPSSDSVTPGTLVILTATAGDPRSGVSTISIYVNGTLAKTCSSTSCIYNFTAAYGQHSYYATSNDNLDNVATAAIQTVTANNAPVISAPIYFTGECKTGTTITLHCNATDANQANLPVAVWAGQCDGLNCFNTRSWATGSGTTYYANSPMAGGGGEYTVNVAISQPTLTGIAATCLATDALGASNPQSQGDNYNPLCIIDGC